MYYVQRYSRRSQRVYQRLHLLVEFRGPRMRVESIDSPTPVGDHPRGTGTTACGQVIPADRFTIRGLVTSDEPIDVRCCTACAKAAQR